jgi:hypothetical protein
MKLNSGAISSSGVRDPKRTQWSTVVASVEALKSPHIVSEKEQKQWLNLMSRIPAMLMPVLEYHRGHYHSCIPTRRLDVVPGQTKGVCSISQRELLKTHVEEQAQSVTALHREDLVFNLQLSTPPCLINSDIRIRSGIQVFSNI